MDEYIRLIFITFIYIHLYIHCAYAILLFRDIFVAVDVESIIPIECSVVRRVICVAVLGCGCSVLFFQLKVRDLCSRGSVCLCSRGAVCLFVDLCVRV